MLIQDVLCDTLISPTALDYQKRVKQARSKSQDVSSAPILRGDQTVAIQDSQYYTVEFDLAIDGSALKLLQTPDHLLIVKKTHSCDVLTPLSPMADTNVSRFHFQTSSQKGAQVMSRQKVVGTTFHALPPYTEFAGQVDRSTQTPTLVGQALLLPEPKNAYDPHAVAVIAKLKSGKPFKIGYLGKNTPLQASITRPTLAKLAIVAYSENGDFNDSYLVEV